MDSVCIREKTKHLLGTRKFIRLPPAAPFYTSISIYLLPSELRCEVNRFIFRKAVLHSWPTAPRRAVIRPLTAAECCKAENDTIYCGPFKDYTKMHFYIISLHFRALRIHSRLQLLCHLFGALSKKYMRGCAVESSSGKFPRQGIRGIANVKMFAILL